MEDSLGKHLGDLSSHGLADASAITVRQALQHRSGIPRHWRNFFTGQGSPLPFVEVIKHHVFVTPALGKRYLYSNANYGLLAAVVEAVTGRPFHEHLKRTIFRPMALATATSLDALARKWDAAVPYEDDGTPIPPYRVDERGARDLVMSAYDLARFGEAHLDRRAGVISAMMLREREPLPPVGVHRASYGLGWVVEEDSPASLFSYGHTGEGPGASSSLAIVPAEELVVATIANRQGPAAYQLNEMIVDALSPMSAARRAAHPFEEEAPDPGAVSAFAGRWRGDLETPSGRQPVTVELTSDRTAQIEIRGRKADLERLIVRDGVLSGRADLQIPGEESERWPHQSRLFVEWDRGGLVGSLAAYAARNPNAHEQFWLSYKLRLANTDP